MYVCMCVCVCVCVRVCVCARTTFFPRHHPKSDPLHQHGGDFNCTHTVTLEKSKHTRAVIRFHDTIAKAAKILRWFFKDVRGHANVSIRVARGTRDENMFVNEDGRKKHGFSGCHWNPAPVARDIQIRKGKKDENHRHGRWRHGTHVRGRF
jgi:hypothetical protein